VKRGILLHFTINHFDFFHKTMGKRSEFEIDLPNRGIGAMIHEHYYRSVAIVEHSSPEGRIYKKIYLKRI
jgi:hypothetical protein